MYFTKWVVRVFVCELVYSYNDMPKDMFIF